PNFEVDAGRRPGHLRRRDLALQVARGRYRRPTVARRQVARLHWAPGHGGSDNVMAQVVIALASLEGVVDSRFADRRIILEAELTIVSAAANPRAIEIALVEEG